jgi:hypothetical protein
VVQRVVEGVSRLRPRLPPLDYNHPKRLCNPHPEIFKTRSEGRQQQQQQQQEQQQQQQQQQPVDSGAAAGDQQPTQLQDAAAAEQAAAAAAAAAAAEQQRQAAEEARRLLSRPIAGFAATRREWSLKVAKAVSQGFLLHAQGGLTVV